MTPPDGQDSLWLNMGWSRNICFLTIRGGHLVTPPGGQDSVFFLFFLFFFWSSLCLAQDIDRVRS